MPTRPMGTDKERRSSILRLVLTFLGIGFLISDGRATCSMPPHPSALIASQYPGDDGTDTQMKPCIARRRPNLETRH